MAVVITKDRLQSVRSWGTQGLCEIPLFQVGCQQPVDFGICVPQHSWKPGGLSGTPPNAKLPSSHVSLTSLHSAGYLTVEISSILAGERGKLLFLSCLL